MKRQCFSEVGQEIFCAVVAGIKVEFVPDTFGLELPVEFLGSFLKSELILVAAVEMDKQPRSLNQTPVLLCEHERTVLIPVTEVNRIAEDGPKHPAQRCRRGHGVGLSGRFCLEAASLRP